MAESAGSVAYAPQECGPGYHTNAESGILLFTHRYLDPAMGRFLTRDPIGFEGGINLYAYVGNGVVSSADSRGLQYDDDECKKALQQAKIWVEKIKKHIQDILNNLPLMTMLCEPNVACAALPKRSPIDELAEKYDKYKGHVKEVTQAKNHLKKLRKTIDSKCRPSLQETHAKDIEAIEDALNVPIPEWPSGVFPCIPLPDLGVPRLPALPPIRIPIPVPVMVR